jgi:hypothetical protein
VIRENVYYFENLVEQLEFDKARLKKYKQILLDSEKFSNFTNRLINLDLSIIRFYKSLENKMSQCSWN